MTLKVAINGFGRIGRNILRALVESEDKDIKVIAINDLGSVEVNAHLLRYDSVHGKFPCPVKVEGQAIDLGGGPILMTSISNPRDLPWAEVDIAMECTGVFTARDQAAAHLENGSKRVLISAPSDQADKTLVYGVNHHTLSKRDLIVSNASCTTNCLAPIVHILNRTFGILKGYMTTIHAYTSDQPLLDSRHKDLYRARAASLSMIPTSTGAAKAVGLVIPELKGKLDGSAIRVPTPNVSLVDLKFVAACDVTVEALNHAIKAAAEGELSDILAYSEEPMVSIDYNHNPYSSCFAAKQTRVMGSNLVRVLSWYDNEWGFSNRMIDTALAMGKWL